MACNTTDEHVVHDVESLRPDDEWEAVRRLPEICGLRGRLQTDVAQVFVDHVPSYFWLIRASESHHPPDERGLGGLWLHTKRVFTAYTMLERTFRAMSTISAFEANCARAGVLLHDAFKYGIEPDNDDGVDYHEYARGRLAHCPEYTDTSHDLLMAEFVRTETRMPEEVAHVIEHHGGSNDWFSHDGPEPCDDLTLLVHLADVIASSSEHRLPVYGPTEELRRCAPDLPTVSDDWIGSLDDF